MSERKATMGRTYGYQRMEVFSALFSIITIWTIVAILYWEASHRIYAIFYLKKSFYINPKLMLVTAIASFVFDVISLWQLGMFTSDGHGIIHNIHGIFKPHGNLQPDQDGMDT